MSLYFDIDISTYIKLHKGKAKTIAGCMVKVSQNMRVDTHIYVFILMYMCFYVHLQYTTQHSTYILAFNTISKVLEIHTYVCKMVDSFVSHIINSFFKSECDNIHKYINCRFLSTT